jgi:hypothetical protein
VFLFRSYNRARRPHLNAISPIPDESQVERTARHLRMCRELAELGMQLAQAAAQRALRDLQAEPPQAEPSQVEPSQAEAPPAPPPAPGTEPREPRRTTDPAILFTRLAGVVRQAVALEARLTAGPPSPSTPHAPAPHAPPDPRRETLTRALDFITEKLPDRATLRREAAQRIDQELAQDPAAATHTEDILVNICDDLRITPDFSRFPDNLLQSLLPPDFDLYDGQPIPGIPGWLPPRRPTGPDPPPRSP